MITLSAGAFWGSLYLGIIILFVIIGVLFWAVISLIFRAYILWYFKINKSVQIQEETNRLLDELVNQNLPLSMPMSTTASHHIERDHSAYMPK
ncbi:MAG: hypothetical protein K2L21_09930 [Muribaculaceae bacterium]|nr:hypothetical protein [Muribaculaceae bacterium]